MGNYEFYLAVIAGSCFYAALRIGFIQNHIRTIAKIMEREEKRRD